MVNHEHDVRVESSSRVWPQLIDIISLVHCVQPPFNALNTLGVKHTHYITLPYIVPSSRIRPLATAVAAPLHPALSLESSLMLLMVGPLEYPLCVSSHFCLGIPLLLAPFILSSITSLPSLLLLPRAQSSLMQPLAPLTPVSVSPPIAAFPI